VSAGIPATKEPVGLLRSDGKRPDGLTLVPWQSGKPLTWDVTVAQTHAASYVSSTARKAGAAAEMAATRKSFKTQVRRPFPFASFSADRSLAGFTGSILSLPTYCSHHITLQLRSASRLFFCCPGVPGRFRCLAIPAFDFNFFELLTLGGIFTTRWKK